MAIQFARCQYVSRTNGGNACRKASYNQRETVKCERTGEVFSFKDRGGNLHHEILLPGGVDQKFKKSAVLWNAAENAEKRKNSQVAKEFVIALPDDKEITLEDRIELTRRFSQIHFVDKGVAVQLDLHAPHEEEGLSPGLSPSENWHAHLLVTTRRFSEDGLKLGAKARDLDPIVRYGNVVEADVWGEIWRDLQNEYFEEKGYEIRVDPIGIVPQEHLGPVRMRHHMNEAILRSQLLLKANEKLSQDPQNIIEEITRHKAVFSQKDVDTFLRKHVPFNERGGLSDKVMEESNVLALYDRETGEKTGNFTTKEVRAEEEKLIRFADHIVNKQTYGLHSVFIEKGLEGKTLSEEQKEAYNICVNSRQNLSIIQGRAGVGKSYLLDSIRIAHEASSYRVLGLAPTHKVAEDLRKEGFKDAKTCHSFLFAFKNDREKLDSNTLLIVDEAGMLGTELSVELFHAIRTSGAKLVLVGDDRQLSSVERGGTFGLLADRYGAVELREVRRQGVEWQKALSEDFSKGDIKSAVQLLDEHNGISWNATKEEALSELLKTWAKDNKDKPHETRLILAQRNIDVDALNEGAREILTQQGKLGDIEITCMTQRGKMDFAEGDRVQFTKTDKEQGLRNGTFGIIEHINTETKKLTVLFDNQERREINPEIYDGLRHGYASTVFKGQGSTLDHTYVLHSRLTNQSISYVALTRQTKSLSLYVSKEETPSQAHLIRQMSREEGKETSLYFYTQQDIEKRQERKSLATHLKHGAEAISTKVKDVFHKNEEFYNVPKPTTQNKEKVTFSLPFFNVQDKSYDEITELCERRLFSIFKEDNGRAPTPEELNELVPQAQRTAEFVFYQYAQKGNDPTHVEMKLLSGRAGFEFERIPEIRLELMKDWERDGNFDEKKDGIAAHMMAERLTFIEGRIILEARAKGITKPSNIPDLAMKELQEHGEQTKSLAVQLAKAHSLSEQVAMHCAKDILQYKETHGEKPSEDQVKKMVEVSKELEKRDYSKLTKDIETYEIDFIRRKEGDMLFRTMSYHDKLPNLGELNIIQKQAKSSLDKVNQDIAKDISHMNQKEFTL